MFFPILTPTPVSPSEFIAYWHKQYDFGNEDAYATVLSKDILTEEDIRLLFLWKNNMGKVEKSMSGKKEVFLAKVNSRLEFLNELKRDFDLGRYISFFGDLSAIWGITLLHVTSSGKYPIYDQHVHRAYRYLTTGDSSEISKYRPTIYRDYQDYYVPFFNSIRIDTPEFTEKQIDDALWAFGRFLSLYPDILPEVGTVKLLVATFGDGTSR